MSSRLNNKNLTNTRNDFLKLTQIRIPGPRCSPIGVDWALIVKIMYSRNVLVRTDPEQGGDLSVIWDVNVDLNGIDASGAIRVALYRKRKVIVRLGRVYVPLQDFSRINSGEVQIILPPNPKKSFIGCEIYLKYESNARALPAQKMSLPAYGIRVVAEPRPGDPPAVVDIIAIHGLDGHREESWTTQRGTMWLKDLLPGQIPTARIITYGYDAATHGSRELSTQTIFGHAQDFLVKVTVIRAQDGTEKRPIIFMAYSLGGIVLKYALILSSQANRSHLATHAAVKLSTAGIIFIGTPHQGTPNVDWALTLLRIRSVFSKISTSILKSLQRDSDQLLTQMALFTPLSSSFIIKFIYETQATPIPGGGAYVLVPQSCAVVHGALDAESVGMNRNHHNLIKFDSNTDDDFVTLVGFLKQIVELSSEKVKRAWNESNVQENAALSPKMMKLLKRIMPKVQLSPRRPCLAGTRIETLKHIMSKISSSEQSILWINGLAGTGKSSLMSTTFEKMLLCNRLGAFIRFDRQEMHDASSFVTTLAYSLALFDPRIGHAISTVIDKSPHSTQRPLLASQFEDLIVKPLATITDLDLMDPIIVLIDGLDECDRGDYRSQLLSLLSQGYESLLPTVPALRFVVASRAESDIQSAFENVAHIDHFVLDIRSPAVNNDIMHFFATEFKTIDSRFQELFSDDVIQKLTRCASGLFIWAAIAIEFIKEYPPRLFDFINAGVPKTPLLALKNLYLTALQAVAGGPGENNDVKKDIRNVLGCILCGDHEDGFTEQMVADLMFGSGQGQHTAGFIIRKLGSVVAADQRSGRLRLLHQSFGDFLTDKKRCGRDWYINLNMCHSALVSSCFQVLEDYPLGWYAEGFDNNPQQTGIIPKHVSYAAQYWAHHLVRQTVDPKRQVCNWLGQFFDHLFLKWLEVMVVVCWEFPNRVTEIFRSLYTWSKNFPEGIKPHMQCILDAFVIVSISLPQHWSPNIIATLFLTWAPVGNILANKYSHMIPYRITHNSPSAFSIQHAIERRTSYKKMLCNSLRHRLTFNFPEMGDTYPLSLDVSADQSHVVTGHFDGTLHIWNSQSGNITHTHVIESQKLVYYTSFFGETSIISLSGGIAWVWNYVSGRSHWLKPLGQEIEVMAQFTGQDCTMLAVASRQRSVLLWAGGDLHTPPRKQVLADLSGDVTAMAFSPNGSQLLVAIDCNIESWSTSTGQLIFKFASPHAGHVVHMQFSPLKSQVVSVEYGGGIFVTDLGATSVSLSMDPHTLPDIKVPKTRLLVQLFNLDRYWTWGTLHITPDLAMVFVFIAGLGLMVLERQDNVTLAVTQCLKMQKQQQTPSDSTVDRFVSQIPPIRPIPSISQVLFSHPSISTTEFQSPKSHIIQGP